MSEIQRNALVCEKIFGWQWIPYTFYDVSSKEDQMWLLPDGQAVSQLSPGEWTYYEEDEHGNIIGNRYIPYWIPHYTTSMDAAWLVVEKVNERGEDGYEVYARFIDELQKIVGSDLFFDLFYCEPGGNHLTPDRICKAALRAVGEVIED